MKIAIFSDVHGNLTALEAVLSDIKKQAPDLIIFAGDLCLFGPRPAACLNLIRQGGIASIYGDKDELLSNQPLLSDDIQTEEQERRQEIADNADWTWAQLSENDRAWLRTLPFHRRVSPTPNPRDDLFIVHANPKDVKQYIYPTEGKQRDIYGEVKQPDNDVRLRHLLGDLFTGVLAFGHLHVPNIRRWQHLILANISSVSLPQDGDMRAKYGLLTWKARSGWTIEHRYISYDVAKEIALLTELQPPGWESFRRCLETAHS